MYLDKIAQTIAAHSPQDGSAWIFGNSVGPTALDAHTVVFIARLIDADRAYLINDVALKYASTHLEEPEWLGITKGNSTLHSVAEKKGQIKI